MEDKRIYYNGTYTYEELLEELKYWSFDFEFRYKNIQYNISEVAFKHKPCIMRCYPDRDEPIAFFDTYEEMLENFKFDDGVRLIDALASKDISNY